MIPDPTTREERLARQSAELAPYQGIAPRPEAPAIIRDEDLRLGAPATGPALAESVPERGGALVPPAYSTKVRRAR